jgi:hypothetical protein
MLALRVREMLFDAYDVLFSGDKIWIIGGRVPSGGDASLCFSHS